MLSEIGSWPFEMLLFFLAEISQKLINMYFHIDGGSGNLSFLSVISELQKLVEFIFP